MTRSCPLNSRYTTHLLIASERHQQDIAIAQQKALFRGRERTEGPRLERVGAMRRRFGALMIRAGQRLAGVAASPAEVLPTATQ